MSQLPTEKVPNSQRIQVLQGEVASLRGQAPAIVCNLMERERHLLANNLVSFGIKVFVLAFNQFYF